MDAFEEIYRHHSAAVRRFALFLTGDPARADDLVAEVFVRAWMARGRIEFGSVRAYLMTIARNLHIDAHRATRIRAVPLDEHVPDHRAGVEVQLQNRANLRSVRARLRTVARGDRRALLLYVCRELSYAEVASELGISVGAVKSRIARAREALSAPAEAASE